MTGCLRSVTPLVSRVTGGGMVCVAVCLAILTELALPAQCLAIQLHQGNEGIIVHQVGHLIFLLSMVVLVFIITGRQLNREHGWKMIQLSAILFVLWNIDTIAAHFFDNQIHAVTVQSLSLWRIKISAMSGSELMAVFYHSIKLDHLLCVPAIFCFYKGVASLVAAERLKLKDKGDLDDGSAGFSREDGV